MKKSILMGIMGLSASALLGLQGCGGSSSSPTPTPTTTPKKPPVTVQLSGAVVDWYIKDALVFADLNMDGIYQAVTEPSVRTDANGFYDLNKSGITATDYNLVAKGGVDKATGNYYAATLLAESHYKNITPLTTLDTLLIRNHGYSSAEADLIVQKLVGMEKQKDVVSLDANPATNKYLLSGARMLAMYNTVLTEVMSQVVKSTNTAIYSEQDIKVKISRDAWDQLAAQVDWHYKDELKKENGDANKVEPKIDDQSLIFTIDRMINQYRTEFNLDATVTVDALMPSGLAKDIYDYVHRVTDEDFVSSAYIFGENEDDDDVYMSEKQTVQDDGVLGVIRTYSVGSEVNVTRIEGDDDKDEYDDHHD